MLPNKHELHTTSTSLTHRTSCQRPTKQNQKYPGTYQIKRRQSCRKYNSSKAGDSGTYQIKLRQSCRKYNSRKAGDFVAPLRIACGRHMLPIKHKLHTASAPHITSTHNNTKSTKPWNSPKKESSILQEIQHHQGWRLGCSSAHRMRTSHATDQTQTSHSIYTTHHVNAQQHKIKRTLELTKRSVVNAAGNTTPARLVISFLFCASHADVTCYRSNTNFTQHPLPTSRQRTTTQNQKYTGTHQIKLRQSCRKYNSSRAGDSVAPLRIACRRHMLPIKHKFHTTSKNHARYTSRQRSTTQN